jgi:hypothetical protein
MPLKNTQIFTFLKSEDMPSILYKSRFIIAILLAVVLLLSSCKKITEAVQPSQTALQQYFEDNILNRDFVVHLAADNGTDLTAQFSGFKFKLTKNTLLDGPMTATNSTNTYTGTWNCNDDYSKLAINLPASVTAFSFLNREWRFTKKTFPIMELAPWGTTELKILHMERL